MSERKRTKASSQASSALTDAQGIEQSLERIVDHSVDAILNKAELEATRSENNDLLLFVKYIRSLKEEAENLTAVNEERDMQTLLAYTTIKLTDSPKYPVSEYVKNIGSRLGSDLRARESVLNGQIDALRIQTGGKSPSGFLETKMNWAGRDIILGDIAQGRIYENDDFIKYMNEILTASIINNCRHNHIEYYPCSGKNMIMTHPSSKSAKYDCASKIPLDQFKGFASADDRSENEILEDFLTDWMFCIKENLERWRSKKDGIAGVFRTSIPLTLQTYFYDDELKKRVTDRQKKIYESGHEILLCYEENTIEGNFFYIIDQLEYGLHHVFNIHDFIFQAFVYVGYPRAMGEFAPGVDIHLKSVDEKFWKKKGMFRHIGNEMDGEEDIFTCVSRATRAAIMLAFIEKPKSILEKPVDDLKKLEFKYFNKISRYHLVKMASWILSNDLIVSHHWRVTGPYNNNFVHEISGPEKAFIVLHDMSEVIHASEPEGHQHPVKLYGFCLDSSSILGTFLEMTRDEIIDPRGSAASTKQRKSASRPKVCLVSKEFPFNTFNTHFVIQ